MTEQNTMKHTHVQTSIKSHWVTDIAQNWDDSIITRWPHGEKQHDSSILFHTLLLNCFFCFSFLVSLFFSVFESVRQAKLAIIVSYWARIRYSRIVLYRIVISFIHALLHLAGHIINPLLTWLPLSLMKYNNASSVLEVLDDNCALYIYLLIYLLT